MPSEAVTELSEAGSMIRVYASGSMYQGLCIRSIVCTQVIRPKTYLNVYQGIYLCVWTFHNNCGISKLCFILHYINIKVGPIMYETCNAFIMSFLF